VGDQQAGGTPAVPSGSAARGRPLTAPGSSSAAFTATDWLLLSSIALIWGASFVLIEIGLRSFAPALIALLRIALGAATLAVVPAARRATIERADRPRILILGVAWVGIPLVLFPMAQQWIDSSVAGMVNGAVPLTAAAWGAVLTRALPRRQQALGLLLGFVGIAAISLPELQGAGPAGSRGALGVALAMAATALYGLALNVAVPLQQRYGGLPVLLRAQVVGMLVVTPFGLAGLTRSTFSWPSLLAMVPLGVLGTGLAFVMMTTLVGRTGSTRGSIAIYFVPVVAIALGALLLGERPARIALAGALLVIVGAWATSRAERPAVPRTPD
jgi:drug/metabolite transporter (DMT)-like permease